MTKQQKIVEKWSYLEFGVKTRVINDFTSRKIDYILKTPNYSNEDVMDEVLESIEFHSREVLEEIKEMYNQVTS